MGFVVESMSRVSKKVIHRCEDICDCIELITPIRHKVGVLLTNRITMSHSDSELAVMRRNVPVTYAMFVRPIRRDFFDERGLWVPGCDCCIILPGRLVEMGKINPIAIKKKITYDANDVVAALLHEVSHYLQYRDRRKVTEVGIEEKIDWLISRMIARQEKFLREAA